MHITALLQAHKTSLQKTCNANALITRYFCNKSEHVCIENEQT
jgi:hypothetical protein